MGLRPSLDVLHSPLCFFVPYSAILPQLGAEEQDRGLRGVYTNIFRTISIFYRGDRDFY